MSVPDEFGITILKPSHQSVWSQWLLNKQNPEITPPNLRNRSWHDFPAVEVCLYMLTHITHTHTETALEIHFTVFAFLSNPEEESRSSIWY